MQLRLARLAIEKRISCRLPIAFSGFIRTRNLIMVREDAEKQIALCLTCKEWKPFEVFPKTTASEWATGKSKWITRAKCRQCHSKYMKAYYDRKKREAGLTPRQSRSIEKLSEFPCTKCGQTKPAADFCIADTRSRNTVQSWCRSCAAIAQKERHKRCPQKRWDQLLRRMETTDGRAKYMWQQVRNKCRRSNKPLICDLTVEWILEKLKTGLCEATGQPFDMRAERELDWLPFSPSVDRIDSSLGYTQDNCRIVFLSVNMAKNMWTEDEAVTTFYYLLKKKGFTITPPDGWSPSPTNP